ncbi:metal-dependent hydrolase [Haloglomus litoreum]|uniref:metal-dependent hydrolase n=1 Tax=Haloglomus litoreum TaxID=3034026 RepID=UPI0023E80DCE|nr:metal-dependent hydrolase [Haloglomus sp. DT116]
MPPTVVHAALGVILAAAALGAAFDRRAAVVALLAGAAPDLDAAVGLLAVPGGLPVPESTHGAVLHTLFIPGLAAAVLYADARRDRRVVDRLGPAGVRLAWVGVVVYAVAGIGLDLFNIATANPFWPVRDQFYAFVGGIVFTNQEFFAQSYVQFGKQGYAVYVGQQGGTAEFFVSSPLNPVRGPNGNSERVVDVVESGWQLLVLVSAPLVGWLAAHSDASAGAAAPSARDGSREAGTGTEADTAPTDD